MGVDIVPSLYAFVAYEGNKSLYKSDDVKTYLSGESLGGGLGVKFLNKVETIHALDLRVKALTSVGGVDWKRATYDASLAWFEILIYNFSYNLGAKARTHSRLCVLAFIF